MTHGTYSNTDNAERLKQEREAREMARVKAIVDGWDGMVGVDENERETIR
jgi:hypothetical protein